jgi:predicted nucleic acid-binding protein
MPNPYYYLDANAFVQLIQIDTSTDRVKEIFTDLSSVKVLSTLTLLETFSTIVRLRHENRITENALKKLKSEIAEAWQPAPLRYPGVTKTVIKRVIQPKHYEEAMKVIEKFGNLRSLDALHFAMVLEYKKYGINLVTGDKELLLTAPREGLGITNLNYCRCPACGKDGIRLFFDRNNGKKIGLKCEHCKQKGCDPCDVSTCQKYAV